MVCTAQKGGPLRTLLILGTAAGALGAAPAYAQAPVTTAEQSNRITAPDAPESGSRRLEEIVVTAQRREQGAQSVPIAIAAFAADTLASRGIDTVRELQNVDAGLNITNYAGSVIPFLRGIGNPSSNTLGNESSVPVYIDEVYYSRISPVYLELNNIDHVEVLKGPQGTLFGRNSSGGLIHVITRDPDLSSFEGEVKAGYDNFDTATGKLYLTGPLTQNVAADLSVSGLHQGEGWGTNRFDGTDIYKQEFINVRSKLLAEFGDTTRILLTGNYARLISSQFLNADHYKGTVGGTPPFYGPVQPLPSLGDSGGFYDANFNLPGQDTFRSYGGSLKIEQGLGFADLVSITSYRKANEEYVVDGDLSKHRYLDYRLPSIDRAFTQELQLKSGGDSSISWILGAFYLDTKQGYTPVRITGDLIESFGLASQDLFGLQKVDSISGYGQATIPVGDKTNFTAGLRYTSDRVHGMGRTEVLPMGAADPIVLGTPYDRTFDFDKLTYKAAVDHRFSPTLMVYTSISRGYKAGTFNTIGLASDPTEPETIDAYELGLKSDLLDRRLRMNVALFQNDISNPQVQALLHDAFTGATFVGLTNADKARSRGIEAEIDASITNNLQLRFAGTLVDAEYIEFENAPQNVRVVDANANPVAPYGIYPLTFADASGNDLPGAAKLRFNVGLNYSVDTAAGEFTFDANLAYTDKFAWESDNIAIEPSARILNSTLMFRPAGNRNLEIRMWGKNITDVQYYSAQVSYPGELGNVGVAAAPRTYGVELGYQF